MAARVVDFEMHAGDYKILEFQIVDSGDVPVPLGGVQAIRWWVAKTVKATTYLLQKEIGAGVTVIDTDLGLVQVVLTSPDTDALGGKDLYHEMEVTNASGYTQTVLYGTMSVIRRLIPTPIPTP